MPSPWGSRQGSAEILPPGSSFEPGKARRAISRTRMAVAVAALGAFATFTWYAYDRAVRPGADSIAPLIKADQEPTRVRPESPGGMEVPHQDKMVYEELAGRGGAPRVERLLPPPEMPLAPPALSEADIATSAGAGSEEVETVIAPVPPSPAPQAPPDVQAETASAAAPSEPVKSAATTPEPTGEASASGAATEPEKAGAAPAAGAPAADKAPAATPAAPASPPEQKPKETEVAAVTQRAGTPPPAAEAGAYRIQVAAVRSREGAEREWRRLKKANGDLLGPLTLTIEKANLGAKGIFYRVRGGPLSRQAAVEACAELKRRKTGCLVVGP